MSDDEDDTVSVGIDIDDHGERLHAIAEKYGWSVERVIEEAFLAGLAILEARALGKN